MNVPKKRYAKKAAWRHICGENCDGGGTRCCLLGWLWSIRTAALTEVCLRLLFSWRQWTTDSSWKRGCIQKVRCLSRLYKQSSSSLRADIGEHAFPQVTQSQRVKTNIKEYKTVKSYVTCSLSSLLGFWVVLEPFCFVFFDFLPKNNNNKNQNGSKPPRNREETTMNK